MLTKGGIALLLEKRKKVLTYTTFVVVLSTCFKVSITKGDLQDIGSNMMLLLAAMLGIDLLHDVYKNKSNVNTD